MLAARLAAHVFRVHAAALALSQGGGGWPSWNWGEFSVAYPSLASQLCIGGVYVRLLLEGGDKSERMRTCSCMCRA